MFKKCSVLGEGGKWLVFRVLREQCGLTDGNLNRHLNVLEEAGAVRIRKTFVKNKPRTTVFITKAGLGRFEEYLVALQRVLETAKQGLKAESKSPGVMGRAALA